MWGVPVQIGILINSFPLERSSLFQRLKEWQDNNSYLTMIGPHFGLSRDYDEFIICMAPPFLGLLAALVREHTESAIYIGEQCVAILKGLSHFSPKISFFPAIWLLHISASANSLNQFELARNFINENGGVNENFLYYPPSSIPLGSDVETESDKQWRNYLQNDPIKVSDINKFKSALLSKFELIRSEEDEVFYFAAKVLNDPVVHSDWAVKIISLLAH